jgi:hypothetical protein
MPPEVGVGTPFGRIHIAHVGQGRAGKIKTTAIGRQQHLHHIEIVQLVNPETKDGRQHLQGRLQGRLEVAESRKLASILLSPPYQAKPQQNIRLA